MRFIFVLFSLIFTFCLSCTAFAADMDTMIGQMLMAGFRGYTVTQDSPIMHDIRDRHLGGVILFDYDVALGKPERNIKNPEQVRALTKAIQDAASTPLFVAVDQEGGRVQRLKAEYGFTATPSALKLGAKDDETVLQAAQTVGETVSEVGFNVDFAPVADVMVDPNSPAIGKIERSFSADPERVAQCDALFLQGFKDNNVIGCLKHFPGHGSAGADSHLGVTDVTKTWSKAELIPYRRLVDGGMAQMIMTAHIFNANLDPNYPATLSRKIIGDILRGEIGYSGVVVTDDMNMRAITDHYGQKEAIRLAIEAGADILLFGNNLTYDPEIVQKAHAVIKEFVESGIISKDRIEASYARIMNLKKTITPCP